MTPLGLMNCGLNQVQPRGCEIKKVVNNLKSLYEFQWLNHKKKRQPQQVEDIQ